MKLVDGWGMPPTTGLVAQLVMSHGWPSEQFRVFRESVGSGLRTFRLDLECSAKMLQLFWANGETPDWTVVSLRVDQVNVMAKDVALRVLARQLEMTPGPRYGVFPRNLRAELRIPMVKQHVVLLARAGS